MKKLKAILRSSVKQAVPGLAKLFGANLLDKKATLEKLKSYLIYSELGEEVDIPASGNTGLPIAPGFAKNDVVATSYSGVYSISGDKTKVYAYGGVKLGSNVLDLDFGSALFIKTLFKGDNREVVKCDNCIVLWSHEWGNGYFDYTVFIYAKLLRIKQAMPADEFAKAKITYPLVNTAFEKELLKYAGVTDEQLLDSKKYNVKASNYYLANNDSWYYPNKRDLLLIKQALLSTTDSQQGAERIYVQRKSRRKLTNEAEVLAVLKDFNFTVIEDKGRTVAEQVAIYKNANVIIGPHGASFTNIINCKMGTTLIELFPKNYYPDYFRYLSYVMGLNYYAIFGDGIEDTHYRNVDEDVTIDPQALRSALQKILS